MELQFLGTCAGMPSKARNTSALVVKLLDEIGENWLFDCGEGTQHRILNTSIRPSKIEKVFITHLHGDHIYGLPGLISSRSFLGGVTPLKIYGPKGLKQWVDTTMSITGTHVTYPLEIIEVTEGLVFEDTNFKVTAATLQHTTKCFGYRIEQKSLPGTLDVNKAKALGVPVGPLLGKLKSGNDITLADGTAIKASDVVSEPKEGFVLAILGDTKTCDNAVVLAQDADVLVHEATFESSESAAAKAHGHSTNVQAANVAKKAGVKTLLLNHISARFLDKDAKALEAEAREIHSDTHITKDYMAFGWNQKNNQLSKL